LNLAQFRELAAFAQFGSDLDKATQRQLSRGERLMELLKQGQYHPIPVELQIVSIYAGTKGLLDGMKVSAIGAFEPFLHRHARDNGAETLDRIVSTGVLDESTEEELSKLIKDAIALFVKEHPEAARA
ncbi:MAG TPA: hypothetical protein VLT32_14440, partial [Candidatus Sulfomarinibacteraceae bacterium]|nr:hypothetical protein [Candidatus Sulfomarinibacteraceae bacterium]